LALFASDDELEGDLSQFPELSKSMDTSELEEIKGAIVLPDELTKAPYMNSCQIQILCGDNNGLPTSGAVKVLNATTSCIDIDKYQPFCGGMPEVSKTEDASLMQQIVESVHRDELAPSVHSTQAVPEVSCSQSQMEALESISSTAALTRCSPADIIFLESVDATSYNITDQIRALGKEAFGKDEDALQLRKGERLAALLLGEEVVGYATYVVRRDLQTFSVHKLGIAQIHRRRGLGRIMLRHLLQLAKRRSRGQLPLEVMCLSALPSSVNFYKACGFHETVGIKLRTSDDIIEGQVYMECCLKRKRSRSTHSKREKL
jgi:GNAT superfamily N-acetyltransferase